MVHKLGKTDSLLSTGEACFFENDCLNFYAQFPFQEQKLSLKFVTDEINK